MAVTNGGIYLLDSPFSSIVFPGEEDPEALQSEEGSYNIIYFIIFSLFLFLSLHRQVLPVPKTLKKMSEKMHVGEVKKKTKKKPSI